ncbi:sensor histidine kinase [Paenibacillus sp. HB172176]|uniref:sensor histidine kinase n=1 Tax=Paenibacillus sp. HB172176 TaxID=2493690 RepID=UPI00143ABC88|nr:sensor histidine kinase [Paenibacillus sp. HB172176]
MRKSDAAKRKTIKLNRFLMLFSLSAVFLMIFATGCLLYVKTERYIGAITEQMQDMQMNQNAADVRKQFEDVYQIMDSLSHSSTLIETLAKLGGGQTTSYEKVLQSRNLESSLFNLNKGNDLIDSIVVWTGDGEYSSKSDYASYYFEGYRLSLEQFGEGIQFIAENRTFDDLYPGHINDEALSQLLADWNRSSYFLCPVEGPEGVLGVLRMSLRLDALLDILPYGDSLSLFDADGKLLFSGPRAVSRIDTGGASVREIGFQGIQVALAFENQRFRNTQLLSLVGNMLIILTVSAALAFFLSQAISRKALFPLHSLVQWIGRHRSLEDRWMPKEDKGGDRRKLTMRDRFLIYFLLTILLPVTVFVTMTYMNSSRIMTRELEESFSVLFTKTAHRIERFVDQKESAMARAAYDPFTVSYVSDSGGARRDEMDQFLFDTTFPTLSEDAVGLYSIRNELIYSNRFKQAPQIDPVFFGKMQSSRKNMFYWLPSGSVSSTVSLAVGIVDLNQDSRSFGYIKTDIAGVFLTDLYGELKGDGSEAYIVDGNGLVISHPDAERIGQSVELPFRIDEMSKNAILTGDAVYYTARISSLPWYLVAKYDVSAIQDQVLRLFFDDIYLLLILFLLTLLFSYSMSQYLVKPLASLHSRYWNIETENVWHKGEEHAYSVDEVEQLRLSFNAMMGRIHQLVQDTVDAREQRLALEFEKKELHLEALQAQISPHFLYNTMENIIYMIEKGDSEPAVETIGLLSRLFRYAMGKESPFATLGEEMAYAKSYVKIMNGRYKDRIRCDWAIDPEMQGCVVIKMLLQPIIENAIQYGMPKAGHVVIGVACQKTAGGMEIAVHDNGPGINARKLAEIRSRLQRRDRGQVGLYNINSRIKLHFGEPYGLRIECGESGGGTTVTLHLPCREA